MTTFDDIPSYYFRRPNSTKEKRSWYVKIYSTDIARVGNNSSAMDDWLFCHSVQRFRWLFHKGRPIRGDL